MDARLRAGKMSSSDETARDLRLRVVVMGGASDQFVRALNLSGNDLPLGRVHEFDLSMCFETFGVDPWAGDASAGPALDRAARLQCCDDSVACSGNCGRRDPTIQAVA